MLSRCQRASSSLAAASLRELKQGPKTVSWASNLPPCSLYSTSAHKPSRVIPAAASKPRQSMTERESKVLTDMLDMIFMHKEREEPSDHKKQEPERKGNEQVGPRQVNDLFGRLRRLAGRRATQTDRAGNLELLDRKKEEMNACETDQELLEWASREVFAESARYAEAAESAVEEGKQKTVLPLQSPIYPQMIAYLMKTFREQYRDPNLALYIFEYAKKLSIVSYTFGCTTDAYNELIETRWTAFKDMKGVLEALTEMDVNVVPSNNRTQQLIERIRRHVGRQPDAIGNTENAKLLMEIEETLARVTIGRATKFTGLHAWKKANMDGDDEGFDVWSNLDALRIDPSLDKTDPTHS